MKKGHKKKSHKKKAHKKEIPEEPIAPDGPMAIGYDAGELILKYYDPRFEPILDADRDGSDPLYMIKAAIVDFRELLINAGTYTEDDLREFATSMGDMLSTASNKLVEHCMLEFLKDVNDNLRIELRHEFKKQLSTRTVFEETPKKSYKIFISLFILLAIAIVSAVTFEQVMHNPALGIAEKTDPQENHETIEPVEEEFEDKVITETVNATLNFSSLLSKVDQMDGAQVQVIGFLMQRNMETNDGIALPEYHVVDDFDNRIRLTKVTAEHRRFFLLGYQTKGIYEVSGILNSAYDLEIKVGSIKKVGRPTMQVNRTVQVKVN